MTADNASIEPTDRSMPPGRITSVCQRTRHDCDLFEQVGQVCEREEVRRLHQDDGRHHEHDSDDPRQRIVQQPSHSLQHVAATTGEASQPAAVVPAVPAGERPEMTICTISSWVRALVLHVCTSLPPFST